MRNVLVGAGLFLLGLFADFFIEHTVNRAPAWLPRLLAALFIPLGVFVVLLSDVVWPHLWSSRANPITSTAIAAAAAGLVAGSLWWFLVASRRSGDVSRLEQPRFPGIEVSIGDSAAKVFLANHTAHDVTVKVRAVDRANHFDQKSLISRPKPPPLVDLGTLKKDQRVEVTSVALKDEMEEACVITTYFGSSDAVGGVYRVYFRKPADVWQSEYTLHDAYSRHKLYQRGGLPESPADKRRRIRYRLSQLIMQGSALKEGFTWLVAPTLDEKTRQLVDPSEKLSKMSIEIQNWTTEATFWTEWELGASYVARLTNPTQSSQYPRGIDELPARDLWRDFWDKLTSHQVKLEEFLKELPEL